MPLSDLGDLFIGLLEGIGELVDIPFGGNGRSDRKSSGGTKRKAAWIVLFILAVIGLLCFLAFS